MVHNRHIGLFSRSLQTSGRESWDPEKAGDEVPALLWDNREARLICLSPICSFILVLELTMVNICRFVCPTSGVSVGKHLIADHSPLPVRGMRMGLISDGLGLQRLEAGFWFPARN